MFVKVDVDSSAIENVAYDEEKKLLRIKFRQGAEYDYPEVPKAEFKNLVSAPSVGKYFNTHIRTYSVNKH